MKSNLVSDLDTKVKLRWNISVLGVIAIIFLAEMDSLLQNNLTMYELPNNYHTILIINALQSKAVRALAPILATLPFSASYIEELETKFVRFFLVRSGYTAYILNRITICYILGGNIFVIGSILAWQIATVIFLPFEITALETASDTVSLAKNILLLGLNGGLWSTIGMTISTIMESKYIAYASPFIVYYLLVILYERYFPNARLLYPKNWLDPEVWPYGVGSAALFLLELTFLCGLVFYIRGKRRLEQL